MFSGSGWRNYTRDGVKELFNLELDYIIPERGNGKVSTRLCLEIVLRWTRKYGQVDKKEIAR